MNGGPDHGVMMARGQGQMGKSARDYAGNAPTAIHACHLPPCPASSVPPNTGKSNPPSPPRTSTPIFRISIPQIIPDLPLYRVTKLITHCNPLQARLRPILQERIRL